VVVPAYNEETRIAMMLDETLEFLESRQKSNPSFKYEVIDFEFDCNWPFLFFILFFFTLLGGSLVIVLEADCCCQ
jgi:hypothetical protein